MNDKIPNRADWGEVLDEDVLYSFETFFGKSNSEMESLFKENITKTHSTLYWMPITPFKYYIIGLKKLIEEKDFSEFDMPDVVECFISVIEGHVESDAEGVKEIWGQLLPLLNDIAENQLDYGADIEIYGNFRDRVDNLIKKMERIMAV